MERVVWDFARASGELFGARVSRTWHPTSGGARRDRTDDLLLAKQALSQLSYGPVQVSGVGFQVSKGARGPLFHPTALRCP